MIHGLGSERISAKSRKFKKEKKIVPPQEKIRACCAKTSFAISNDGPAMF